MTGKLEKSNNDCEGKNKKMSNTSISKRSSSNTKKVRDCFS